MTAPRPVCRECAKRESVTRDASAPDAAWAACVFCGVETRGREILARKATVEESAALDRWIGVRRDRDADSVRVDRTGKPWLVGRALVTMPPYDPAPSVCARLTCDVCGELVATGPAAASEAIAAYKLGRTGAGLEHFGTCRDGALGLSFIPAGSN